MEKEYKSARRNREKKTFSTRQAYHIEPATATKLYTAVSQLDEAEVAVDLDEVLLAQQRYPVNDTAPPYPVQIGVHQEASQAHLLELGQNGKAMNSQSGTGLLVTRLESNAGGSGGGDAHIFLLNDRVKGLGHDDVSEKDRDPVGVTRLDRRGELEGGDRLFYLIGEAGLVDGGEETEAV